ncbi:hypothetical protein PATSB16_23640 [Pandoraea thiooxydans]|nr:hypothetical protein PATSB16_23640 [Pandoraea thiooxydans]
MLMHADLLSRAIERDSNHALSMLGFYIRPRPCQRIEREVH